MCQEPYAQCEYGQAAVEPPSYSSNVRSSIGGVMGDGMDMHRLVWVKLSLVFPRRPDAPAPAQLPDPRAVDATAEVPGDLVRVAHSRRRVAGTGDVPTALRRRSLRRVRPHSAWGPD